MGQIELSRFEKDTIYRVQHVIKATRTMNETILRELISKLRPREKGDFRHFTVERQILDWWHFIGQWSWPLSSFGKNAATNIVPEMIKDAFGETDPMTMIYKDKCLVFCKPGEEKGEKFFVEVRPLMGKASLWPELVPTKEFGVVPSDYLEKNHLTMDDVCVAYAYMKGANQ